MQHADRRAPRQLRLLGAVLLTLALGGCPAPPPERIVDEPMEAGWSADDFPELATDVLAGMDPGVELTGDGVKGRNAARCRIERIETSAPGRVAVFLALADGQRLVSEVTRRTVEHLGLQPGQPITALIKSAALMG